MSAWVSAVIWVMAFLAMVGLCVVIVLPLLYAAMRLGGL